MSLRPFGRALGRGLAAALLITGPALAQDNRPAQPAAAASTARELTLTMC